MNPVGKIPVMDDDGFVLFESGAICKYLSRKMDSGIYPSELREQSKVNQWTDFVAIHINGAMGRVVFNRIFATFAKVDVDEQSLKDGLNFLSRFLPVVDTQLGHQPNLAGKTFTLADITLLSSLDPAEVADIDLSGYSNIVKWRNELKQKEFYIKCYKDYGDILQHEKV